MTTDPALYIILAAMLGGSIGFLTASVFASARMRGLYNRGWNAGRDFAVRQTADLMRR